MNLFIDMGGVLMHHNLPGCLAALREHMSDEAMARVLGMLPNAEGLPNSMMEQFERGEVDEPTFVSRLIAGMHTPVSREEVVRIWNIMHAGIPKESLDLLRRYADAGHHLYLLSNSNPIHERDILTHYDMSCFEYLFFSHRMHVHKPERRMYEQVCEYLKEHHRADDVTVFVDDIAMNREVGESFGWITFDGLDALQRAYPLA